MISLLLAIVMTFVLLPTRALTKAQDESHIFNFNDDNLIAFLSADDFLSNFSSYTNYLKTNENISSVMLKSDLLQNLLSNGDLSSENNDVLINNELKGVISSLHKAGLSVGACVDFEGMDLSDGSIYNNVKTSLINLINTYLIDGFEITSDIEETIFSSLKKDLEAVEGNIVLYSQKDFSGGSIPSWLERNYEVYSVLSSDIKTGDKLNRIDVNAYTGNSSTLQKHALGLNAIMPGKPVITLGEEFLGNDGNAIDWSKLEENSDIKDYFDKIIGLRQKFSPIKNGSGEFTEAVNAKDTDLFVGVWHNDNDYEWRDLLIVSNSSSITRTYAAEGNWVIISDGDNYDDENGIKTVSETITVAPNSLTIAVDKDSFDGKRAGDTNSDSIVNDQDAIHLLFHIYFDDIYPVEGNCDFDCNGVVNDQDAIYLLFHIYFNDDYPIVVESEFNPNAKITDFNHTWHQCPQIVREYLDNTTYNPEDYSYTNIKDYAPEITQVMPLVNQFNVRPVGKAVGNTIYYNNEPGVPVAYDLGNVSGTVTALDSVRWINTLSVNVRDLGGWKCDGGTVKYGLIFRGGEIHTNDINAFVNELGIKRELNLRGSETANTVSPFGDNISFYRPATFKQYTISANRNPYMKESILFCMDGVIKGEPVYIHCLVGADRTGTMAFLLEQVLGMEQSDIDKDYELTMFHTTQMERTRCNSSNYLRLVNEIKAKPGDTMRDKTVNYLVSIGVPLDTINAFRKAMINGNPETLK